MWAIKTNTNDSMVVLTVDNQVYQAMDSTILVHPKRPDMWHAKSHGVMDVEVESKNKGTFLKYETNSFLR